MEDYTDNSKTNLAKAKIKAAIASRPEFKLFLEENHAYGRFVKEATKRNSKSTEASIILDSDPIFTILTWSRTTEHATFWSRLSNKWDRVRMSTTTRRKK